MTTQNDRNPRYRVRAALIAAAALLVLAAAGAEAARFGTGCQRDFQNNWQDTVPYVWNRCSGFNNELDDTDTKVFYYNLHGAEWWWENAGDQLTLDNVNLFYGNTHGGGWDTRSVWAMWDDGMYASSDQMRLGDESYGLSIFSTYACETLKFNDGKMWTRMGPLFRGGLRYATGSHDKLYDSTTTDEVGEDYADDLQKGKKIKYAWKDSSSDWYVDNDATVMATGRTASECGNRRDNMTWYNYNSYTRLRDGQIGYYCYTYWHNL